jgi:hypothetical protein
MNQYEFIKFPVSKGRDRQKEREKGAVWKRDTGPQNDEGGVECRSTAQNVLVIKKCVFDLF